MKIIKDMPLFVLDYVLFILWLFTGNKVAIVVCALISIILLEGDWNYDKNERENDG